MTRGPILIDLEDDASSVSPQDAPVVPEPMDHTETATMQHVAALVSRRPSLLARWFWGLLVAILGFVVSLAAWDYVNGLIARSPTLGFAITILLALFCIVLLVIALKELAAFSRLRRVDAIQHQAEAALASADLKDARAVNDQLLRLYRDRADLAWGKDRLAEQSSDVLDADGLLALSERSLLEPLDERAQREVEAAARQVATVTAIVPLALADLIAALTANLRMIRRIAEIYGGRSGFFGSWRLTRSVLTHLVATGAVAIGDDLIGSVAGGGVLSKVSRRFGEGVVNGALTARVGVAAMEVCRPLAFKAVEKPSVTGLVKRALTGLFQSSSG